MTPRVEGTKVKRSDTKMLLRLAGAQISKQGTAPLLQRPQKAGHDTAGSGSTERNQGGQLVMREGC